MREKMSDFVGQLVEQLTLNQRAQGSSPCEVTKFLIMPLI